MISAVKLVAAVWPSRAYEWRSITPQVDSSGRTMGFNFGNGGGVSLPDGTTFNFGGGGGVYFGGATVGGIPEEQQVSSALAQSIDWSKEAVHNLEGRAFHFIRDRHCMEIQLPGNIVIKDRESGGVLYAGRCPAGSTLLREIKGSLMPKLPSYDAKVMELPSSTRSSEERGETAESRWLSIPSELSVAMSGETIPHVELPEHCVVGHVEQLGGYFCIEACFDPNIVSSHGHGIDKAMGAELKPDGCDTSFYKEVDMHLRELFIGDIFVASQANLYTAMESKPRNLLAAVIDLSLYVDGLGEKLRMNQSIVEGLDRKLSAVQKQLPVEEKKAQRALYHFVIGETDSHEGQEESKRRRLSVRSSNQYCIEALLDNKTAELSGMKTGSCLEVDSGAVQVQKLFSPSKLEMFNVSVMQPGVPENEKKVTDAASKLNEDLTEKEKKVTDSVSKLRGAVDDTKKDIMGHANELSKTVRDLWKSLNVPKEESDDTVNEQKENLLSNLLQKVVDEFKNLFPTSKDGGEQLSAAIYRESGCFTLHGPKKDVRLASAALEVMGHGKVKLLPAKYAEEELAVKPCEEEDPSSIGQIRKASSLWPAVVKTYQVIDSAVGEDFAKSLQMKKKIPLPPDRDLEPMPNSSVRWPGEDKELKDCLEELSTRKESAPKDAALSYAFKGMTESKIEEPQEDAFVNLCNEMKARCNGAKGTKYDEGAYQKYVDLGTALEKESNSTGAKGDKITPTPGTQGAQGGFDWQQYTGGKGGNGGAQGGAADTQGGFNWQQYTGGKGGNGGAQAGAQGGAADTQGGFNWQQYTGGKGGNGGAQAGAQGGGQDASDPKRGGYNYNHFVDRFKSFHYADYMNKGFDKLGSETLADNDMYCMGIKCIDSEECIKGVCVPTKGHSYIHAVE